MFKKMFELQNKLNVYTNGNDWVHGMTNKGKVINWERAIYLELAEAIESFPWKHWKSIEQQPDIDNLKIELVDLWHFIMSSVISTQTMITHLNKDTVSIYCENCCSSSLLEGINYDRIIYLLNDAYSVKTIKEVPYEWTLSDHQNINQNIDILEELMIVSLELNKAKKDINEIQTIELLNKLIIMFGYAMKTYGLTIDELYKLYIGKNVLNQIRQDNGYKEGTYVKIWDGEEDNVHMTAIVNQTNIDELTFDYLYKKLDNIYNELNKG